MEVFNQILAIYNQAQAYLLANAQDILAVIGAVYVIALFVVKLTPTPRDNEILEKAHKFIIGLIGKLGIKK